MVAHLNEITRMVIYKDEKSAGLDEEICSFHFVRMSITTSSAIEPVKRSLLPGLSIVLEGRSLTTR